MRLVTRAAWQESTLGTYGKWWRLFVGFLSRERLCPTSEDDFVDCARNFCADLVLQLNFGAAKLALAAIAHAVKMEFGFDLWRHAHFRAFHKGVEKHANIVLEKRPKRSPLPASAIAHFVLSPPKGISAYDHALMAAVCAVGLRCMRRADELCNLFEHQLISVDQRTAKIRVATSKTDPTGAQNFEIVFEAGESAADPIACLERYLSVAKGRSLAGWRGNSQCRLFTFSGGRPLVSSDITRFVRVIAQNAQLEGHWTSHSIKIGGLNEAIAAGLSLEQILAIGGWKASSSVAAYVRSQIGARIGASARMGL